MARRLTMKQEQFCQEYVSGNGNATQAVVKAYAIPPTLSARVIGSENLDKPNIAARIKELSQSIASTSLEEINRGALHAAVCQATKAIAHADTCETPFKCEKCKDVKDARRFLLDVATAFESVGDKTTEHKHVHLTFPKRD